MEGIMIFMGTLIATLLTVYVTGVILGGKWNV